MKTPYPKTMTRLDEEQRMKGHSPRTRNAYQALCLRFLDAFRGVAEVTPEQVRQYFIDMAGSFAPGTVNLHQDAVRFLLTYVFHKPELMFGVKHIPLPRHLPKIHSKEQVEDMIDATRNPKHRLLLSLCYGSGLRVTELCNLRVGDVYSDRMQVRVGDRGKGGKHRFTTLAPDVPALMESQCHGYGPMEFVFQGYDGGPYSTRSASKVYEQACNRVGVMPTGIHTLRHSFATHLIESGCDTKTVAELLGHQSVKTTEQYIHLSVRHKAGVQSPLASRGTKESEREKLSALRVA